MSRQIITAVRASTIICGLAAANNNGVWLLPANVCPAVPLALLQSNTRFEFIDIDPASLSMDVALAQLRIKHKTAVPVAGVIYVRSYGHVDQNGNTALLRLRETLTSPAILIDDQCLAVPQTELNALKPDAANAIIFSTGTGKVVDLDGGGYGVLFGTPAYAPPPPLKPDAAEQAYTALTTRYKAAMLARRPFFVPKSDQKIAPWAAGNPGIAWPALQKNISNALPEVIAHKAALNRIYDEGLQDCTGLKPLPPSSQVWRYSVSAQRRDAFLALLFAQGLFASAHYYPASALFGEQHCPHALALYGNILNLFNDLNFTEDQAKRVVSLARDFYS